MIALVGWYLRRHLPESPAFAHLQQTRMVSSSPAREIFASHRLSLFQVIGLVVLHGVGFYIFYVYLPGYVTKVTGLPQGTTLLINTGCMALMAILIPLMGKLADRFSPQWILGIGATGLALGAIPIFVGLTSGQITLVIAAQASATVLVAAYMGPFFAIVAILFPVSGRYTGLSLSYNIASALFGGTAPLVATLLTDLERKQLGTRLVCQRVCAPLPHHAFHNPH